MSIINSLQNITVKEYIFAHESGKYPVSVARGTYSKEENFEIVLKSYKNSRLEDHENEIMFLRELSGKHYTFIKFFGSFYENNRVYIISEYWEDDLYLFLSKYIKKNIQVNNEDLNRIIHCLIDGFATLESLGIYHRDIKLKNILIKRNFQVKIIDFNISINLGRPLEKSEKQEFNVCGTSSFMSPELYRYHTSNQKKGTYHVGLSDVYSLGIVFLFLLAKINPETNIKTINTQSFNQYLNKIQDKSQRELIHCMIHQDPLQRKTFLELRDQLRNYDSALPLGHIQSEFWQDFKLHYKKVKENIYTALTEYQSSLIQIYFFAGKESELGLKCANVLNNLSKGECHSVSFYGAFEESNNIYVLFNPYDMTLRDLIIKKRQERSMFEVSEILEVLRKIIDCLVALKLVGIHHNNLSPENIFIYGNDLRLFGFHYPVSTRKKSTLSPSPYSAPELLRMMRISFYSDYDLEKSDVYSVGVIIYELCTLQHPESIKINQNQILTNLIISDIDENIRFYLSAMLKPDPEERVSLSLLHTNLHEPYTVY